MSFWDKIEAKKSFQKLPCYNTFVEKQKNNGLKNIELLHDLSFHDELNIYEMSKSFGRYARYFKAELIDSKDPSA